LLRDCDNITLVSLYALQIIVSFYLTANIQSDFIAASCLFGCVTQWQKK